MLATSPTPLESLAAPRVHSAGDLCKAMLGVAGYPEPLVMTDEIRRRVDQRWAEYGVT